MSLTDWDSRTQHVDIETNAPASPDDNIIPVKLRTNDNKMRRSKSRGSIARKLKFSNTKPKKNSMCNGVSCSIQGGRRRTKRMRRKRTKRIRKKRRKRRKTRRKKK